jgi:hypothetical protein
MNTFCKRILPMCLLIMTASLAAADVSADADRNLRTTMHKLWEDHITYTRNFIISFAGNLPDQDAVAARLMKNQEDIGGAIGGFYGEAAGKQLTTLLKEHIQGAVEVLKGAKSGDQAAFTQANSKWHANGDQIAAFLTKANPQNWPANVTKAEMAKHLDLTLQEASNRLKGNYAADIGDYDKVHDHILHFADVLTDGIVKQFPDKFK